MSSLADIFVRSQSIGLETLSGIISGLSSDPDALVIGAAFSSHSPTHLPFLFPVTRHSAWDRFRDHPRSGPGLVGGRLGRLPQLRFYRFRLRPFYPLPRLGPGPSLQARGHPYPEYPLGKIER